MNKKGPKEQKERLAWLKSEHGLGTNYASWIAGKSAGKSQEFETGDEYLSHAYDYVDALYAGPKEHLREIYDAILAFAKTMGNRHRVSPCRTIVPIYRNHVIGAGQADHAHPHRPGTGAEGREDAEAADRHRRLREERPHHPPH